MKKKIFLIIAFYLLTISAAPVPTQAEETTTVDMRKSVFDVYDAFANIVGLQKTNSIGQDGNTLEFMVAKIVSLIMGFLGVLFLALTVWGGIRWMWARGNEEEAKKARDIIKDAIIGLAIVLTSYVIAMGITFYLTLATGTAY